MSRVLAIEPDRVQADILEGVHADLGVNLIVVSSKDDAIAAIERDVPDLILVNALLSPREEVDLVAHLRSLDNLSHVQLLTIPRLARKQTAAPRKSSLFGFAKKRTQPAAPDGCDPEAFAEQITTYLARAQEEKTRPRRQVADSPRPPIAPPPPPYEEPAAPEPPALAFAEAERPSDVAPVYEGLDALASEPTLDASVAADVDRLFDRLGFEPPVSLWEPPVAAEPVPVAGEVAPSEQDLVDFEAPPLPLSDDEPLIADELRLELQEAAVPAAPPAPVIDFDRLRADAEAALAAELQRVQAEAAEQRERELAQWQAEAEALREATVGRARAEAEAKAREALAEELERSRAVSEQLRHDEMARLQAESDERLEEVTRQARQVAEAEAARAFTEELTRVRADSEAVAARALEEEVARVRAEADARLQAELERVRREAEEARRAEHAAAQAEAERLREAAAREAREVAEAAAARALEAEVQRVRAEAEAVRRAAEERLAEQSRAHANASEAIAEAERVREAAAREARAIAEAAAAEKLEAELRRVREEAETRRKEFDEAQVKAEKAREAAAREARLVAEAAAAQSLETEIRRVKQDADARLASELERLRIEAERRRELELQDIRRQVQEMRETAAEQARTAASEAISAEVARAATLRGTPTPHKPIDVIRVAPATHPQAHAPATPSAAQESPAVPFESRTPSSSYYDLWRAEDPAGSAGESRSTAVAAPSRFRRKRWMLPAAAAALFALCGGIGLSVNAAAWAASAKKAFTSALPDAATKADVTAPSDASPRTGDLLVETTPKGALVSVDGTARGKTPLTVAALTPGRHTVLLRSDDGVVIQREITIRAGERAVTSELMVSGWLNVASRVPVDVYLGTTRVGTSGDQQIVLSPGRHKLTFVNKQYDVRETRAVEIRAGSIATHSLKLPNGTVTVEAPSGAEVRIDGERVGAAPVTRLPVGVGTRDVAVTHASFGERHASVVVKPAASVTVTVAEDSDASGSFNGLKVLSESAANPGLRRSVRR